MLFGSKNQPCKLIVHRFWSLQQTSQYAKYQTYTNIQDVYCVAVLSFNRFRWKVFTPFSFSDEKKSKKVDKKFVNRNDNVVPLHSKDWTRTGLQPTFDIFRVWDAVHVITREMRKKRPLPQIPFKVPIRMRHLKKKTEVKWNGKRLTFVLWQTYIPQIAVLFVSIAIRRIHVNPW